MLPRGPEKVTRPRPQRDRTENRSQACPQAGVPIPAVPAPVGGPFKCSLEMRLKLCGQSRVHPVIIRLFSTVPASVQSGEGHGPGGPEKIPLGTGGSQRWPFLLKKLVWKPGSGTALMKGRFQLQGSEWSCSRCISLSYPGP